METERDWIGLIPQSQTRAVRVVYFTRRAHRALRSGVQPLGANAPKVRTLESVIFSAGAQPRVQTTLASAFSAAALVLALVGLYVTMSFSVARRARELGIRVALGSTKEAIASLFVLEGLKTALVGGALGTAVALVVAKVLSGVLYGIGAVDLFALVLVPTVVTLFCMAASYLPGRRAATIHAAELLRAQ